MVLFRLVALLVFFVAAAFVGTASTAIVRSVNEPSALHVATRDGTSIDDDDDDDADIHEFGTPAPGSDRDDDDDGDADADASPTDGLAASQRIAMNGALRSFASRAGIRPSGGHRRTSDRPPQA